jgi:hypothetical protein
MARRSTPTPALFALISATLLALIAAGCVSLPLPRPETFRSPIPLPARLYLPQMAERTDQPGWRAVRQAVMPSRI